MLTDLKNATVVIVGASSGLGRLAALAFARRGANLVLAARNREALEQVAWKAGLEGVRAIAVPTDATHPDEVERLAQTADRFGDGIDVWVNNLGAGAIGSFVETPLRAHEQVLAVNLRAHVYGAKAVLPIFIRQGHGILIETNSVGAFAPAPYAAAYAASKFGLRGLTESLHGELSAYRDIHVCALYPTFMDTPGMRHGANYSGRELNVPPGVIDPQRTAEAMVRLALRPRPAATVGVQSRLARLAHLLAPHLMARAMARAFEAWHAVARPAAGSQGNLYAPSQRWMSATGGWRAPRQRTGLALGLAGLLGLGLALALSARRR